MEKLPNKKSEITIQTENLYEHTCSELVDFFIFTLLFLNRNTWTEKVFLLSSPTRHKEPHQTPLGVTIHKDP